MLALLLALSPAHADRAEEVQAPCALSVDATQPTADATDVPVDIAPSFVVAGCGTPGSTLVTVRTLEEGTVVFSELLEVADHPWSDHQVVELPQLMLEPDTAYDLVLEGEFLQSGWTFTTGSGLAGGLDGSEVTLTIDEATAYRDNAVLVSEISGTLANTSGRPARITSPDLPDLAHGMSPDNEAFWLALSLSTETPCFLPEVRDDRGSWHAGEEVCISLDLVDPPDRAGCSSTGLWGLFLGPLPLLFIRRRG